MDKIRNYVDRFFKGKEINRSYSLTATEMMAFMEEMTDADRLLYSIATFFRYGYAKGYRAAKSEMKKKGGVEAVKAGAAYGQ